jgi:hypothetical protein
MNRRTLNWIVLAMTLSGSIAWSDLSAQPVSAPGRFWFSGGAGLGRLDEAGAGLMVDFAYQKGAQLFALHSTAVVGGYELGHIAGEIGLIYGRASTGRGARQWSAAVGLSFVQVDISGEVFENTVGLPITAEASLNSPNVGIGLRGFANLNPARSFGGLALVLRLGGLRA